MRMMSGCFTWFPNCLVLGEPNIYHDLGDFTRMWEDCGGCLTVKNQWGLLTGEDGGTWDTNLRRYNVVTEEELQKVKWKPDESSGVHIGVHQGKS